MKVLSLFSGIGAFEKSLERNNVPYTLVRYCEIDKYASKSYAAIHRVSENKNLWDVTKINTDALPDFDIMTWGFPCQDISVAGKGAGISEGTRSGLYYEGLRILRAKRPKYSIVENVKNLVGKKFHAQYLEMLDDFAQSGYNSYSRVLNAKDFGIPQNRERVFIVSIRQDVDPYADTLEGYPWPEPFDNGLRLKDFLEDEVDEKFYISEEKTARLIEQIKDKPYHSQDYCYAIDANYFKGPSPSDLTNGKRQTVIEPNECNFLGNINNEDFGTGYAGGVWDVKRVSPTLTTMQGGGRQPHILEQDFRVRKLTPLECWRLMGFDDADFHKAQAAGISNSQLYKQAGNSIVVNVLDALMNPLYQIEGGKGNAKRNLQAVSPMAI